jgi:hypothetical protein
VQNSWRFGWRTRQRCFGERGHSARCRRHLAGSSLDNSQTITKFTTRLARDTVKLSGNRSVQRRWRGLIFSLRQRRRKKIDLENKR